MKRKLAGDQNSKFESLWSVEKSKLSKIVCIGVIKVLQKCLETTQYTLFQNGHHVEKNWHELNKNKVIRPSAILIPFCIIFHGKENKFESKGKWQLFCNINWLTLFILIPPKLALMPLFLCNLHQGFFAWWPFWKKVYGLRKKLF